jgi:hypothetical protein
VPPIGSAFAHAAGISTTPGQMKQAPRMNPSIMPAAIQKKCDEASFAGLQSASFSLTRQSLGGGITGCGCSRTRSI